MISNNQELLVSICCITYNQAKYIRDCLDGFLMQKGDISFEVLIHDDASTDGTKEIIKEYSQQYPTIIKPIYEEENQYSQGKNVLRYNLDRIAGRYFAICEGDDFWIDPYKLFKQVHYMENHKNISICSHSRMCLNSINKMYYKDKIYDISGLSNEEVCRKLIMGEITFGTQTLLIRSSVFFDNRERYYKLSENAPMGDAQLCLLMTMAGTACFLPEYMATYRVHSSSVSHFGDKDKARIFIERATITLCKIAEAIGHPEWNNDIKKRYALPSPESKTSVPKRNNRFTISCFKHFPVNVYWWLKKLYLHARYCIYYHFH